MSTAIDQIGETAGLVWHYLDQNGSVSLTRLVKEVESPRDVIMQSLGWLAREEKITIDESARSKTVSLR
jgi:hypothetical protein